MKLLFVGLNYFPDEVGIALYSGQLCEAMAARGHRVTAVVGQPYYPDWRYRPGHKGWQSSVESGVRLTRCPHYVPRRPSGARRILHHLSFAASALIPALRAARRERPDVVITVAPSLFSLPVARWCARISGARSWVHVQDFEVEAAVATGLFDKGSRAVRLAAGLERAWLTAFDRASSISPQMCAKLVEKGCPPDHVLELRNWVAAAADGDGAGYRRQWNLGARKVVLYSGSIAIKQGIAIIVDAARALARRDDICFIICGDGPERATLDAAAAALPNLQVHSLQPRERLGDLLAMADVHVLPQIASAADLVLPSKLTNMLATGRPIVATASPGTGLHAEVEGCGICVPPGNLPAFADAIERLVDQREMAAQMGRQAALRASERWSAEAILSRWESELRALAEEVGAGKGNRTPLASLEG